MLKVVILLFFGALILCVIPLLYYNVSLPVYIAHFNGEDCSEQQLKDYYKSLGIKLMSEGLSELYSDDHEPGTILCHLPINLVWDSFEESIHKNHGTHIPSSKGIDGVFRYYKEFSTICTNEYELVDTDIANYLIDRKNKVAIFCGFLTSKFIPFNSVLPATITVKGEIYEVLRHTKSAFHSKAGSPYKDTEIHAFSNSELVNLAFEGFNVVIDEHK